MQDFFEFFNPYWAALFVNASFIVVAVAAQLFLSSPQEDHVLHQADSRSSNLEFQTSMLPALEEQQLIQRDPSTEKDMHDDIVNSSSPVPGAPLRNGDPGAWPQTQSLDAMQIELSHVSRVRRYTSGKVRTQS